MKKPAGLCSGHTCATLPRGEDDDGIDPGVRLHDLIIDSANNGRLEKLVEMLVSQILWVGKFAALVPGRVNRSFQEHLSMLETLLEGDREMAETKMRLQVSGSQRKYFGQKSDPWMQFGYIARKLMHYSGW